MQANKEQRRMVGERGRLTTWAWALGGTGGRKGTAVCLLPPTAASCTRPWLRDGESPSLPCCHGRLCVWILARSPEQGRPGSGDERENAGEMSVDDLVRAGTGVWGGSQSITGRARTGCRFRCRYSQSKTLYTN